MREEDAGFWTAAHYGHCLSGAIRHAALINALSDGVSATRRAVRAEREEERKGYCLTEEGKEHAAMMTVKALCLLLKAAARGDGERGSHLNNHPTPRPYTN